MRRINVSPSAYRRVTALAVAALAFIVVTGGAVRLTGSGLGCPDWPTCADERLVAPWEYHAMVEFVNRTITGLVSAAVMLAVLGSAYRRPRRRDLVWLSAGLVAGVLGQIVLGGLTVRYELKPQFVMAHFLLSMVLLANAVVLHHRAGEPDPPPVPRSPLRGPLGPSQPVVDRELNLLGGVMVAAAVVVLLLGTVVTSSGPHGGDPEAERLSFFVPDVARLHGMAVMLFLAVTLIAVLRVARAGGPAVAVLRQRGEVLLAVLVAQAGVGYVQYFTGVPALLVGVHIAGATAVWVATLRFFLAMSAPAAGRGGRPAASPASEVLSGRG